MFYISQRFQSCRYLIGYGVFELFEEEFQEDIELRAEGIFW